MRRHGFIEEISMKLIAVAIFIVIVAVVVMSLVTGVQEFVLEQVFGP